MKKRARRLVLAVALLSTQVAHAQDNSLDLERKPDREAFQEFPNPLANKKQPKPKKTTPKTQEVSKKPALSSTFAGNASWYGIPFHGRKTASGEVFDMYKLSAAHLRYPLPTWALVEEPKSGNVVVLKVNDRGPYAKGRVMDLSREAARRLGTLSRGVAYIEGVVIDPPQSPK